MLSRYTRDTIPNSDNSILSPTEESILNNVELTEVPQIIKQDEAIEFFECVHCSQWNIIKSKAKKRRVTKTRHVKVNDVTWGSLRRYSIVNNISMDYALMTLLHAAKTKNISYLMSERKLVEPPVKKDLPVHKDDKQDKATRN